MIGRFQDLIAACITGPGPGAVAVVRISGQGAWTAASKVCRTWPASPSSHRAFTTELTNGGDALVLPFAEGRSYTGEEAVEISLHGSPAGVRSLLEALAQAGARPALAGEFTQRAFLNGRLDLAQAEGVKAQIEAMTDAQARHASHLRQGKLSQALREIREEIASVLTAIEASTDFSEEVGEVDGPLQASRLESAAQKLGLLCRQGDYGRAIQQGWRVALIGQPNAGKSSLLNALVQSERAIVTPIPGTTRDTLEERLEIRGLPFLLIDTAGLRPAGEDPIEALGMDRARQAAEAADLVWLVYDGQRGWTEEDEALSQSFTRPALRVATRRDLGGSGAGSLWVSSVTGEGVPDLLEATLATLPPEAETPLLARHLPLIQGAGESVDLASDTLLSPLPSDLAVVHLQAAIRQLGEVTGDHAPADVIERIFREFCIGK